MWVEKLASAGEEISTMREKYVSRLKTKLDETGNLYNAKSGAEFCL
jgi:recombinational DNA repair ATPase RecF